ncbi:MAG: DUF2851 family protein [Chloroflexi bacterium]|nr:DUF2851 family protein [Chloroflexota bacterium]
MSFPSENEVVRLWQRLQMIEGLESEDGLPVKVVYPGRPGDGHGADFRDAIVFCNHGVTAGDIEIHVRSSDWSRHWHLTDPAYNRVVLHVVMWHDTRQPTILQNGRSVPVLALARYLPEGPGHRADQQPLPSGPCLPCNQMQQSFNAAAIGGVLDGAGEVRFFAKSARFRMRIEQGETGQTLYEGIMEALGYVKNVTPFLELAQRLPLKTLEGAAGSGGSTGLQKLLLMTAGLAPPPQYGEGDRKLEFRRERRASIFEPASREWYLCGVRPKNSPVRRLIALGHLIRRYGGEGLVKALTGKVRDVPDKGGHRELEEAFIVSVPGIGRKRETLLGREKAAVIVINVLLPFSHALARFTSQPGLGQKASDLYRAYPFRATNSIEKHMCRQLGVDRKLVNSARRQQGLLHIYKNLCSQGKCGECAIASRQPKK